MVLGRDEICENLTNACGGWPPCLLVLLQSPGNSYPTDSGNIKLVKPKTDLLPVIVQNQTKQRQQQLADN